MRALLGIWVTQKSQIGFCLCIRSITEKLCLHKEVVDESRKRWCIVWNSNDERRQMEGRRRENEPMEDRATGERAAAAQLWVNHSFHFSLIPRERKEGGWEDEEWRLGGAAGHTMATGKRNLIIRVWLWLLGRRFGTHGILFQCFSVYVGIWVVRLYVHLWLPMCSGSTCSDVC